MPVSKLTHDEAAKIGAYICDHFVCQEDDINFMQRVNSKKDPAKNDLSFKRAAEECGFTDLGIQEYLHVCWAARIFRCTICRCWYHDRDLSHAYRDCFRCTRNGRQSRRERGGATPMPMRPRNSYKAPFSEVCHLVTYAQAASDLQVSVARITKLVREGKLAEHPIETSKIISESVRRYATGYDHAETDTPSREGENTLHVVAPTDYDVPSARRLWSN